MEGSGGVGSGAIREDPPGCQALGQGSAVTGSRVSKTPNGQIEIHAGKCNSNCRRRTARAVWSHRMF